MMKKSILVIFSLAFTLIASAQSTSSHESDAVKNLISKKAGQGTVTMHHEKAIDDLIVLSKEVTRQNGAIGYTVQLFRGNNGQVSRQNAERIKSEYLRKDPRGQISVKYTNPNWRVHAGQFRTYAEALKHKVYIENELPKYKNQTYIVRVKLH